MPRGASPACSIPTTGSTTTSPTRFRRAKGLCDPEIVEMVVREAPYRIGELIGWGTHFDEVDGQVALGLEGGHSHARIVHALGDETGREIMRAVISKARARKNIRIWKNSLTVDLITHEGECRGVLVWDRRRGFTLVWARAVVLATGGAGQLYRETTNPPIATADGHAMAFRAGAELRDMEFMQFHPTVLYIAGSTRHLLTEALRGEGAYPARRERRAIHAGLSSPGRAGAPGRRFAGDRRPDGRRPSTRACTSTSRTSTPEHIRGRFPGIDRLCRNFDLDITRDPIPVCPGAHYMIGGVTVDPHGTNDAAGPLGRRRGDQLGPPRRQSAGLEQPARRAGLRQPGRGRHRRRAGSGRAPAARGASGLGTADPGPPGRDRSGRPARVAACTHVAARRDHPRRSRPQGGVRPRRALGTIHPAARIRRSERLDHAEHAPGRPTDDHRGQPAAASRAACIIAAIIPRAIPAMNQHISLQCNRLGTMPGRVAARPVEHVRGRTCTAHDGRTR